MKSRSKLMLAIATCVALLAAQPQRSHAGDREWAVAGKILAGVVGCQILSGGGLHVGVGVPSSVHVRIGGRPSCRGRSVVSHRHGVPSRHGVVRYGKPSHRSSWHHIPHSSRFRSHAAPFTHYRPSRIVASVSCAPAVPVVYTSTSVVSVPHVVAASASHGGGGSDLVLVDNGVVKRVDELTRIYQPLVRGHVATVQTRPYVGHPWLTQREHPPIW